MNNNILTEYSDKILTITLNRPEKLNALSPNLLQELKAELDEASTNDAISVVIIKSTGRAFCVGYDLNEENWITSQYPAN
jgi:enoyl-CoA hydratase/carnithine racemase